MGGPRPTRRAFLAGVTAMATLGLPAEVRADHGPADGLLLLERADELAAAEALALEDDTGGLVLED